MNKLFLIIPAIILTGCAEKYAPVSLPPVPQEIMTPPCKMAPPSADSDEDLQADVQNAECTRQLRLKVYRLQDWVRNSRQK